MLLLVAVVVVAGECDVVGDWDGAWDCEGVEDGSGRARRRADSGERIRNFGG